jgi:hypothetical protein
MPRSKFKVRQDVDMVERSENEDKASVAFDSAFMLIGTFCAFFPQNVNLKI